MCDGLAYGTAFRNFDSITDIDFNTGRYMRINMTVMAFVSMIFINVPKIVPAHYARILHFLFYYDPTKDSSTHWEVIAVKGAVGIFTFFSWNFHFETNILLNHFLFNQSYYSIYSIFSS